MQRRRLAVVIYSAFPSTGGGRETWLANLLPRLAEAGYDITLYIRASREPAVHDLSAVPRLVRRPIPTPGIGPRLVRLALANLPVAMNIAAFERRVERALREDGFAGGVVLGLDAIIDVAPAIRLRRRDERTRVICAVHGYVAAELGHTFPYARPFLGRIERRRLLACDAVTANGADSLAYLAQRGVAATLVPNGVDVERFSKPPEVLPPALAEARQRGDAIIVCVAALRDIKGIRELIASLPALRHLHGPRFRVFVVGKGDSEPYRRVAKSLGVDEHVSFAGEQRDVAPWLHGADVSVSVAGGAGILLAGIEAMAAGLPLVTWDTPMYRQFIEHGRTGILVPQADVRALAAALASLLADAQRRRELGQLAHEAARAYDWSVAAARLIEVLDRVWDVDRQPERP